MYSRSPSVIVIRFSLKLDIINRFLKSNQVLIFKISVQWEPSCSIRTNGPMDTQQEEKIIVFRKFAKALKVNTKSNTPA